MVKEVGLRVRLIAYLKDSTNALIGRGGKPSKGGALNLKSNLNTRGNIVFSLGVCPTDSGGPYYSGGAMVPYTTS